MPRKTLAALREAPVAPQEVSFEGEHLLVVGRHHYLVESRSEPGSWYCIDLEGVEDYEGRCTCRSSETRHTCRHEDAVRRWLGLPT